MTTFLTLNLMRAYTLADVKASFDPGVLHALLSNLTGTGLNHEFQGSTR